LLPVKVQFSTTSVLKPGDVLKYRTVCLMPEITTVAPDQLCHERFEDCPNHEIIVEIAFVTYRDLEAALGAPVRFDGPDCKVEFHYVAFVQPVSQQDYRQMSTAGYSPPHLHHKNAQKGPALKRGTFKSYCNKYV